MLWTLLVACRSPDGTTPTDTLPATTADTAAEPNRCLPPGGPQNPQSIEAALDLVDALPGPVDVPCFLQALQRPLYAELTMDTLSAQPAHSEQSPRIFLRTGALTISVVPEGYSRPLIEFAEYVPETGLSIKAELKLPVEPPIDHRMPFQRVLNAKLTTGSVCGLCHWDETEVGDEVYASVPLRPTKTTLVDLEDLRAERERCDWGEEPDRCLMLASLFDHGEVIYAPFPAEWPTLYDNH